MSDQAILVTGAAGFIGFHVARQLLSEGRDVVGLDNLEQLLRPGAEAGAARISCARIRDFGFVQADLADRPSMAVAVREAPVSRSSSTSRPRPACVYSIDHPHAYVDANIEGFVNVLEGCRHNGCKHLLFASSSSVYGANTKLPFSVQDNVDHPISLYAASKKANELMAHTYSHLYRLPATGLRFFTVYGPWGRPDMAMFIFAKAIVEGTPIKLFNHGNMRRDFTFVDDVSEAIVRLIDRPPQGNPDWSGDRPDPSSSAAPWKIYNIGNNNPGRAHACGFAAGEGVRPHRHQGDVADAARRRAGDLCRCRRSGARHRVSAGDHD